MTSSRLTWLLCAALVPAAALVGPASGYAARAVIYLTLQRDGTPCYSDVPLDSSSRIIRTGLAGTPLHAYPARLPTRAPIAMVRLIDGIAMRHGVDPALVEAVASVESDFNPASISPKGAMGLMQLMPATASRYGLRDAWNPAQNIEAGVRYLKALLGTYQGDTELALAAYNAGEAAVNTHHLRIPPYPETRRYVPEVLKRYAQYRVQRLSDGGWQ